MIVSTYLKDKKNKIEFTCGLIHQNATSKFHREATQTKLVRHKINQLIKN